MAIWYTHRLIQATRTPAASPQPPDTPTLWTPADWRTHYQERAAILEHEAGLARAAAEEEALQQCLQLWSGRRCG